ncbi:MAG: hypothetical protein EZS28_052812, partial [Streblomastix strix]
GNLFRHIGYVNLLPDYQYEQYIPHPYYHRTPYFPHKKGSNTISDVINDGRSTFRIVNKGAEFTSFEQEAKRVIELSTNFHSHSFPQWESINPLHVNNSRNPCFSAERPYQCENLRRNANQETLRPQEIYNIDPSELVIFGNGDMNCVKQGQIQDSQLISSLIVMRHMETKLGQSLIKDKIYPQDNNGNALYNPNGQYRLKIHINGTWRMSEIDDQLRCETLEDWQ